MASTSQFLGCYRRAASSPARALQSSFRTPSITSRTTSAISARQFTASSLNQKEYPQDLSTNSKTKTDKYPDDEHTTSKAKGSDQLDVQSANAQHGMKSAKKDTGGSATEGKDSAGGVAQAKKEFPEAPDAIGMQDERGGRGG